MDWTLPGTVLRLPREDISQADTTLKAMFLAGDIALSQVVHITGLEPHTVQNWVRRGFLSPPQGKRYSMRQLCRILLFNMLKSAMSLEAICKLISHINGSLTDESDDLIDDSQLYFLFVKLAAQARNLGDPANWEQALDKALQEYDEPIPGARDRVETVLRIMLTAWIAAKMRCQTEQMLENLT